VSLNLEHCTFTLECFQSEEESSETAEEEENQSSNKKGKGKRKRQPFLEPEIEVEYQKLIADILNVLGSEKDRAIFLNFYWDIVNHPVAMSVHFRAHVEEVWWKYRSEDMKKLVSTQKKKKADSSTN